MVCAFFLGGGRWGKGCDVESVMDRDTSVTHTHTLFLPEERLPNHSLPRQSKVSRTGVKKKEEKNKRFPPLIDQSTGI